MSRKRTHEDVSSEDEKVFVYYKDTKLSSIPKDLTSLRIDKSVRKIPANAFKGQRNLTNVEYEEGLEVIGEKAFFRCSKLREQQFPSTLIEIGKSAFGWCTFLESLGRLPLSLKIVREEAFSSCAKLQYIEFHDGVRLEEAVLKDCSSISYCSLPGGMKFVPERLFHGCWSLVRVNLPSSVIEIGDRAFFRCEKLATMELPAGLKKIGKEALSSSELERFNCPADVESIGDAALESCRCLLSVILPPKLEIISGALFMNCNKLKDISIPQSVVRVEGDAFRCSGLIRLDLSRSNITSIGEYAFADCSNLKDIVLPRTGLKRIEEWTFAQCESLTHLWIPPTVEYIDKGAFAGCFSLLSVEVPETLKRILLIGKPPMLQEYALCGYRSLVNMYLPPSHQLELDEVDDVDDHVFREELKLAEAEWGYEALVGKLKRRFDSLPLHQVCYFQSYYSRQENIRRLRSIATADPDACDKVDFLGMAPFHIVALSHRPRLYLFQELLSVSSLDIMKYQDVFGASPLDYLCKNHSAAAVFVTKSLLLNVVEPRISFLGKDKWRNDVTSYLDEVETVDATGLAAKVTSACKMLEKFEWMEVLSLLEMSIWKVKVHAEKEKATGKDARESCRISCGSNIVLKNVLPFLEDNRPNS